TSDILPLAASGPVAAMPKPMVIGWPDGAWADALSTAAASAAVASSAAATRSDFNGASMAFLQMSLWRIRNGEWRVESGKPRRAFGLAPFAIRYSPFDSLLAIRYSHFLVIPIPPRRG